MKNEHLKWLGTGFLLALLIIVGIAAVPAFQDFNTNQFSTSGNKVSIKSGVLLTNAFNNGVAIGGGGVSFNDLVLTQSAGYTWSVPLTNTFVLGTNGTTSGSGASVTEFLWIPTKHSLRAGNWIFDDSVNMTNIGDTTVVFGEDNMAQDAYGVVSGGLNNQIRTIGAGSSQAVISGGNGNVIETNGQRSVIGGGYQNFCRGTYTTISGGNRNVSDGSFNVIGGGDNNYIYFNTDFSFIGGGSGNLIDTNVTQDYSGIGWGLNNTIRSASSIQFASILAGHDNVAGATETFVIGSKMNNLSKTNIDVGFNDTFKTTFNGLMQLSRGGINYKSNGLTVAQITANMTNGDFWVGTLSNQLMSFWMSNNITQFKILVP